MQENTPAAAECHMRGCARVLFTCESVRYGCDDQPLELRLDSGFQVLHLQYHLLRLWKRDVTTTADSGYGRGSDVTVVIDRCCNKLVNEDRSGLREAAKTNENADDSETLSRVLYLLAVWRQSKVK